MRISVSLLLVTCSMKPRTAGVLLHCKKNYWDLTDIECQVWTEQCMYVCISIECVYMRVCAHVCIYVCARVFACVCSYARVQSWEMEDMARFLTYTLMPKLISVLQYMHLLLSKTHQLSKYLKWLLHKVCHSTLALSVGHSPFSKIYCKHAYGHLSVPNGHLMAYILSQ